MSFILLFSSLYLSIKHTYSCNKVDTLYDLESHKLKKYKGITIETQQLPDIVNTKEIDKIIITPDKPYDSRTTFRFSLEKG